MKGHGRHFWVLLKAMLFFLHPSDQSIAFYQEIVSLDLSLICLTFRLLIITKMTIKFKMRQKRPEYITTLEQFCNIEQDLQNNLSYVQAKIAQKTSRENLVLPSSTIFKLKQRARKRQIRHIEAIPFALSVSIECPNNIKPSQNWWNL